MTSLQWALDSVDMSINDLIIRINNMQNDIKKSVARNKYRHDKDIDMYISTKKNKNKRGKDKYNTYGISPATVYNIINGKRVTRDKAILIRTVVNKERKKHGLSELDYQDMGIELSKKGIEK